jgi:ferredoxin
MAIYQLFALISLLICAVIFFFTFAFAFVSWREEEPRATKIAVLFTILLPLPYLIAGLIDLRWQTAVSPILISLTAVGIIILLLPIGNNFPEDDDTPTSRIDERDIMFSRMVLEPGSARFEEYYSRRPEKREPDNNFRKRPGLASEGALYYNPITASAAQASFKAVAAFHAMLDNEHLPQSAKRVEPDNMTQTIKAWAKKLGAVSVGITKLQDYHLYSTIGRGEKYGEPVELNHTFGIAFTVEMDKLLLDRAPHGPTMMESAQQYLSSGAIAVQLAEFIRGLGYSARAHIDGSYRVVCPLVARDAGLGEIGRMGLLMTPELGPRVRLAVVTTNLPLIADERQRDLSMIDFCTRCKKCADVCPSKSISFTDREEIDGVLRWQIDSESCFTYWCTIGTDCGRCMSVCPYSHPNNLMHNLVRAGIKQSALFREAALKLDDFVYGRFPATLDNPDWL